MNKNKSIKKFIPTYCYKTVYDVDYNKLYSSGIKIILFDLDNTLISYENDVPTEEIKQLFMNIDSLGLKSLILSNNKEKRLSKFCESINCGYICKAKKPMKTAFKKVIKKYNFQTQEMILIGDQLMTDIFGASRMHINSILVKPINLESEHFYTRFFRVLEKKVLRKMKKVYYDDYIKISKCKDINNE